MLGLFAFFYGCLHFTTYIWLDQFFDWPGMVKDVAKRPFITVGFTAFVADDSAGAHVDDRRRSGGWAAGGGTCCTGWST